MTEAANTRWLSLNIWRMAVIIGVAYWFGALARSGVAFEQLAALPMAVVVAWKGLFSLTLALSVWLAKRGRTSNLVAAALATSAIGDMMLVTISVAAGGTAFAVAHAIAIYAYGSNRASQPSAIRWIVAAAVPLLAVAVSYLVLRGSSQPIALALFPLISGTMAATAILSRFPIWLTGLGAAIFVISDILFLADLGILNRSGTLGFLTWASYAVGYALVARGAATLGTPGEQ